MLQLFPFAGWLAIGTSFGVLVALCALGDVGRRSGTILLAWLVLAGYCQFLVPSSIVAAVGLALQTMLAIYLIVRWRLTA